MAEWMEKNKIPSKFLSTAYINMEKMDVPMAKLMGKFLSCRKELIGSFEIA